MRLLLTGASSGLGKSLLPRLSSATEVWCVGRREVPGRFLGLDLEGPVDLSAIPGPLDLVVHVAGLTHSSDLSRYDAVNRAGTLKLAEAARAKGCRRFVYISTRCVGAGSGAYGESKKAAEDALKLMSWERLLIIRPSEVYGAGSKEGIDALINAARRFHLAPMLFGDARISFAPIHAQDFTEVALASILSPADGVETVEAHGPELLSGVEVAMRLVKRYRAVPVPIFVPALSPFSRLGLFTPDQLARLTGGKSSGPLPVDAAKLRRFPG